MASFGVISYAVDWGLQRTKLDLGTALFLTAAAVTFLAGLVGRFTGRQSTGNMMTGLNVLVPGAYAINTLVGGGAQNFIIEILYRATVIGLGGWTGIMLCSPFTPGIDTI